MMIDKDDFGPFNGHTWINAASTGVLPRVAIDAALDHVTLNRSPANHDEELFGEIPQQLKQELGRLVNVPENEIILGNSASYGLHLWANGLPLKKEEEVVLVKGDFPATILPWLQLRHKGVVVKEIKPQSSCFTVDDLEKVATDNTRIFCGTWVDSFTGNALDLLRLGEICHDKGIWFLLNGTQAVGARPIDLSKVPVDGLVSSGYKWMCGPYSTGFCWLNPDILQQLEYNQAYWLPMQGDRDFDQLRDYQLRDNLGAAKYDVFCTANPFNYIPWTKSIEYLNAQGIKAIQQHNDNLVSLIINELNQQKYDILSPIDASERTAIMIISHKDESRNKGIFEGLHEQKIHLSFREGYLRISPHLYNTREDIANLVSYFNQV